MGLKKTLVSILLAGAVTLGLGNKAKADIIYQDNFEGRDYGTLINSGNWSTDGQNDTFNGWATYDETIRAWNEYLSTKFASYYGGRVVAEAFGEDTNYLRFTVPQAQTNLSGSLDFDYLTQVSGNLFVYANGNKINGFISQNDGQSHHFHLDMNYPVNEIDFRCQASGSHYLSEIDNFRLELVQTPEPTTMSLLALSGLGLLARRRKYKAN